MLARLLDEPEGSVLFATAAAGEATSGVDAAGVGVDIVHTGRCV